MDELAVSSSNLNLLEVISDDEYNAGYEEKNDEEEEEEMEEGDYSSDLSESETEIETITDSNKFENVTPVINADSPANSQTSPAQMNVVELHEVSDVASDPQPTLSEEAEIRADNLTSELLTAELSGYSWIRSTVPEEEVKEIVKNLSIKKDAYDYLPRVFYVDKEDFDTWKEKDGDDHFFTLPPKTGTMFF